MMFGDRGDGRLLEPCSARHVRAADAGVFCGEKGGQGLQEIPAVKMTDGLPDGVHGQLGYTDINGWHTNLCGGQRADGRAAGQIVTHDELLAGHLCHGAELTEHTGGERIGGITLARIGFNYRPLVEQGQMIRIMLAGKVGVHCMGIVDGEEEGSGNDTLAQVGVGVQPFQNAFEKRTLSPCHRETADLFVVVEDDQAVAISWACSHRPNQGMAGEEVVEPGAGDKFSIQPDPAKGLGVIEEKVKGENGRVGSFRMLTNQLFPQQFAERRRRGGARGKHHHWHEIGLLVDTPLIVRFPVKMDGQAGNGGHRSLEIDQAAANGFAVAGPADSAGDGQVAIKPGAKQGASIDLDTKLHAAVVQLYRVGFDFQARAICMGSGHAQRQTGIWLIGQGKGDQARTVAGSVVGSRQEALPGRAFIKTDKSLPAEDVDTVHHRMVCGWRVVDEGKKIIEIIGNMCHGVWGKVQ